MRATRHLLLATQTFLLVLVVPWSWLATDGPAGSHTLRNGLLLGAGTFLIQGLVPFLVLRLVGRSTAARWPRGLAAVGAWSLALGPWLVVSLWWREPFADLPRADRATAVGAVTVVGVALAVAAAAWIARRPASAGWTAIARGHAVVVALVVAGGLLTGVTTFLGGPSPRTVDTPPNVVLLVADALRHDAIGAPDVTPSIDAWSRDATIFDGAVANGPTSIPGHASLLSGQGIEIHGAFTNHHSLADAGDGIAHRLAAHGYTTVGVCANQLVSRDSGFADGFDLYWSTTQSRVAGAPVPLGLLDVPIVRIALEVLDVDVAALSIALVAPRLPQPFFLFAQVLHTHTPYQDRVGWTTPARVDSLAALYESGALPNTSGYPDRELAHFHATYLGAVRSVDALFGRWRHALGARYGAAHVRWILTSDHGEVLGEHGHAMVGHHEGPYNASLRIPLIADTPRRGAHLDLLTGQDRVASLAEWIVAPDARTLEEVVRRDRHFALTDSAYVLMDDSLKVVWSRTRPERVPQVHRWRTDLHDRGGRPVTGVAAAESLASELTALVETSDIANRIRTTETLNDDRLRALRALGYIE